MNPHEKTCRLFFNYIRNILVLVGHDIFAQEFFKPYWLTYIMYGLHVVMFTGASKTMYDLAEKLNMIVFTGLAFQVNRIKFSNFDN